MAAVRGVTATNTLYRGQFEIDGTVATVTGTAARHLASTVTLHMTAGSPAALARGELLVGSKTAAADHLKVGHAVAVKFAETGATVTRVGGICSPPRSVSGPG